MIRLILTVTCLLIIAYVLTHIDLTDTTPDYKAECFAKGGFAYQETMNGSRGMCLFKNPKY